MSRDDATVLDMVRAARLVVEFTRGLDKGAFLADRKTQSAVLHQLLVLGEAVKRLSASYRARHSAIPWRPIAGMRDRLIHGYDAVDLEAVWQTASVDIPRLVGLLEGVAPREGQQGQ